MRQNDRADLDDMARDIALTELTKHAVLSYSLPDQQTGEKFAAFTYLHSDAQNPPSRFRGTPLTHFSGKVRLLRRV